MPEWSGKAATFDISPPSSPESTTSRTSQRASQPVPPTPSAGTAETAASQFPSSSTPPPPPAAAPAPAPAAPAVTAQAPAPPPQQLRPPPAAEASPPAPPQKPAPPLPSRAQNAPPLQPRTQGRRRPSLKVRQPSTEGGGETRRAAGTGPEPSPSGSAVPDEEKIQSGGAVRSRPPAAAAAPAPVRIWAAKGGPTPGIQHGDSAKPSTPAVKSKVARSSPARPAGKGTPARRGKRKQGAAADADAPTLATRGTPGRGQAGSGSRAAAGRGGPSSSSSSSAGPRSSEAADRMPSPAGDPAAPPVGMLARRMLDVEVVEAAGLLGTEKGGVSNPRADILLVDLGGRQIKAEGVKRTKVIKGTTNPVWNHKVSFGHRTNLSSPVGGNMPTLRLQVYSEQIFAGDKPLGMVDIPLVSLSVDGEEWEQNYSLEPFGKLRAGGRLGSIHLRLKMGPVVDKRFNNSSKIFEDLSKALEDRGDEDVEHLESPPNFLRVTLHQAQELLAKDIGGTSDPVVIFRIGGKEQRSSIVYKDCNPGWEEVFEFEVTSSSESLEITVEDDDRFVNEFLGFVNILMGDLADKRKMRQWFDLRLKSGELPPGEERGAIEITTQWFHKPSAAPVSEKKKVDFRVAKWLGPRDSDTSDTDEEEEVNPQEDPNAQIAARDADPEAKKKRQEEKDALLAELNDFKVVSGDYVAYVHIIEVRELKGEDLQGTSDPVVYVEAFGQKFATEVVKDRLNAVFDETFVISLRNMDQDDFKEGVFRIAVMDADVTIGGIGSLKADLIGAVSFDATYVYFNKDHEVHRRWVALVDDENPDDVGIQGYLHLSIAIVGPGDRLKVHDEEADRRRERAAEANAGGMDSLVVMPPAIEVQQKWLVTTIAKAEYLPVMDNSFGGGAGGGDYFFQVEVAGGKPIRTKKVTLSGDRHRLNPEWRSELWQPVTTPCMSGNVKYSIWDWDAVGDNDLVGVYYGNLRQIEKNMKNTVRGRVPTRWVNLYGPPLVIPESRNFKVLTKRAATLGLVSQTDYLNQYLNFPQHASTYRGRVLVTERIAERAPKSHEKDKIAWRRKVKAPPVPKAAQYAMRIFVGSGTEIPQFTDVTNFGKNKKMWLRVSVGRYEVSTEPVENNKGVCEWYQSLQLKSNFNLAAEPDQVPDLIIHLMAGTGSGAEPCSFKRFPARALIEENFGGTPHWIRLQEDKVLDLLADTEFPGSVLVRMGLGPIHSYIKNKTKWKDEIQGLLRREPYELRVHVYQARNLPATDSTGLIDPYLKVKFKGQVVNTEDNKDLRRRQTVDPVWYHTIRFNTALPPKEYQAYFPQVTVQLFDHDLGFVDDYAGNLFLDLQDLEIIQADRRTESLPPPPTPNWECFFMETPGDAQGELLVSVQLIHTKSADLPEPESIVPKTRSAHLDMVIMGIRNMQPYHYLPMQLPYCVFEVDDMDGTKRSVLTDPSNKPTGRDANFLQRIKMELELPLDVIYAPRVKIRVYDTRLGGFSVPLVGSGRIELAKKLPWGPEYEAPLAKTFAKDALLRAFTGDEGADDDDIEGEGDRTPGTPVNGLASSRPSSRAGGGLRWGSDDDESEFEFAPRPAGPNTPAGKSGFGGAALFGGSTGTPSTRNTGEGRTSRRAFGSGTSTKGRSHGRARSRADFGSGGGAMELLRQSSVGSTAGGWGTASVVDNTPHINASGDVMDTGIGVMPALDVARQKAGDTAATANGDGGVGGLLADAGLVDDGVGDVPGGAVTAATGIGSGWQEEDDDEISQVPNYLKGREELEESLEEELVETPFESYDLYRGQVLGAIGGGSTLKKVGKLKCIVRVTEGNPDDEPLFVEKRSFPSLAEAKARNDAIMAEVLKPKGYKVRLYILQALNLTPMDLGIGGRPGKSDPYLKVKLGKESFDDKKNYVEDVTDADFYKCIQLNSTLPGASQLQIDVMDYDDIGRDELIGTTVIDLEDRWFDTRWQAWGLQNRSEDLHNPRFQTKPVETRTLLVPTSLAPQGQLRCWVDVMSSDDARFFPPDDVSLPPNLDFEIRVVFWKCKDVVSMDTATDQNDLFVRSWVEGCDAQETDTHWFAKKGKGSFNWRMKFKVPLGPRTKAWKFPYLTVQLWDRDLFKFNDHIAEGQLDLGPYFRRAYKTRDTVKLFPAIDPKLQLMHEADLKNMEVDARRGDNATATNATERLVADLESGPAAYDPEVLHRPPPPPYSGEAGGAGDANDTVGDWSGSAGETVSGENALYQGRMPEGGRGAAVTSAGASRKRQKKKKGCCDYLCICCCPGRHIKGAKVEPGDSSDEDVEAAADAKAFVNQIKNMTGLWDDDPDETYWLNMERTNYSTGQKEQMGKCLLGVQIWPIEKAEQQPVGNGRNDPNNEPFLPPPTGRLRFSLNPFVMGSELFGPKICAKIACVCCCVISIFLLVYFSGFFNLIFSFLLALIK